MIMPTDKDYKSTKKIKRGIAEIKDFNPLAQWIDKKYEVSTLNIIFDYIDNDKAHPRLQICLEYEKDKVKFMDSKDHYFDSRKQKEIAEKYLELNSKHKSNSNSNLLKKILELGRSTNNLFVYFTDFESVAKIEANQSIPESKIEKLKSELEKSNIWEIDRAFFGVTYFLYTEEQLQKYRDSETHKKWNEQYFDLLRTHDEFGYFNKENFYISLDSKENFDKNYKGNWYYYYK